MSERTQATKGDTVDPATVVFLLDVMLLSDGQADVGPMVQITSAYWRHEIRPRLDNIRAAYPLLEPAR